VSSPAGTRSANERELLYLNPPLTIGDRVVRPWPAGEGITHSSIGDKWTNDNSKRNTPPIPTV